MHKKKFSTEKALEREIKKMDEAPLKKDKSFVQSLPDEVNRKGSRKSQGKAFKSLFKQINKQMDEVM